MPAGGDPASWLPTYKTFSFGESHLTVQNRAGAFPFQRVILSVLSVGTLPAAFLARLAAFDAVQFA